LVRGFRLLKDGLVLDEDRPIGDLARLVADDGGKGRHDRREDRDPAVEGEPRLALVTLRERVVLSGMAHIEAPEGARYPRSEALDGFRRVLDLGRAREAVADELAP